MFGLVGEVVSVSDGVDGVWIFARDVDDLRALVDFGVDAAVEDEGNYEGFDVGFGNVEFGGDVRDCDFGVWFDEF